VYLQFFGLTEAPFSITPDPAFVYLSAAHRDALAHLLYGVGQGGAGGFVQLTGEVGTGKTTICRCLLEQVPEDTSIALILNPMLTPRELLATICEELDVDTHGIHDSSKALVDALNDFLLQEHSQGRRVVVVIDEAQNLSPDALEQVRLLTNLETAKHKLLQIVLLGQPELRQLLQRQNLRQLAQRITARYHLAPLGEADTSAYVRHRMQVAGARRNPFKRPALRALYQRSGGVPRLINIIADRSLAGAYARELDSIDAKLVHAAANEVQPSESRVRRNPWPSLAAAISALLLVAVSIFMWGLPRLEQPRDAPSLPEPSVAIPGGVTDSEIRLPEAGALSPATKTIASSPQSANALASPEAATTVSAAGAPSSSALMDAAWMDEQHRLVWRGLADLWQDGNNADAIQAACDGQARTGYACLRDRGSWARVQNLGLPVILVLHDQVDRQVLLRGLEDKQVLLGAGEKRLVLNREQLEPTWLGEFIVAWPQAPDWPAEIKRGESGAAVEIVMQMAAQASPPWIGGSIFDAGFELWLMDFQRRHALVADGIIGPKTLLYLMAPTITEPRLSMAGEERY
jgi:general secretion pathway protein A